LVLVQLTFGFAQKNLKSVQKKFQKINVEYADSKTSPLLKKIWQALRP
jgi:hypothetical protein